MSQITVSVSGDNNTLLKEITMNSGETMPDLITALESIKSQTNVFLTELVQASNTKGPVNTVPDQPKESAVEIDENDESPEKVAKS